MPFENCGYGQDFQYVKRWPLRALLAKRAQLQDQDLEQVPSSGLRAPSADVSSYSTNGNQGPWPEMQSPFLCDMSGGPITAQGVKRCLRRIGQLSDIREEEELYDVGLNTLRPPAFTGHSLRRTGAREWTRLHVSREKLKALGRWSSDSIDLYLEGMFVTLDCDATAREDSNIEVHRRFEKYCQTAPGHPQFRLQCPKPFSVRDPIYSARGPGPTIGPRFEMLCSFINQAKSRTFASCGHAAWGCDKLAEQVWLEMHGFHAQGLHLDNKA